MSVHPAGERPSIVISLPYLSFVVTAVPILMVHDALKGIRIAG